MFTSLFGTLFVLCLSNATLANEKIPPLNAINSKQQSQKAMEEIRPNERAPSPPAVSTSDSMQSEDHSFHRMAIGNFR